jgi:hypothetical protein
VASLPIRHNKIGKGRSRSPCTYKYHQKRTEEGRKKNLAIDEKKLKRGQKNREKSNGEKQREIRKRK